LAAGEAIGLLLSLTSAASGDSGPGTGNYMLLLALTSEHSAAPLDTTGQTVLTKGPGGPAFSKKRWRELMALIAAEKAAKQKAQESPEAKEALEPVISAAEGVIAAAPLIDDLPDDLGDLTRALRTAVSASKLPEMMRQSELAGEVGRRVELEIYARMELEDRRDEDVVLMLLDQEREAFARQMHKFLRKQLKSRR
jgi:hypothetical protein